MIKIKNTRKLNSFSRRRTTKFNQKIYNVYNIYYFFREKLSRLMPLSQYEKLSLLEHDIFSKNHNNSIPTGKYMKLTSLYIFDIIAKENVVSLKKGLKKMQSSKTIKISPFGNDDLQRVFEYLDSTSLELSSTCSWQLLGHYKLENKSNTKYIDGIDIYISNFSASYNGIRFRVIPTIEFLNMYNNMVEKNIEDKKYISINKRGKLRDGSIFSKGEYSGSIYKSELLNDYIVNLKDCFSKYISKYFPIELYSKGILNPSVNIYKTNINHNQREKSIHEFARSMSLDLRLGNISSDGKLGLFIQSNDDTSNSINLIAHESFTNDYFDLDTNLLMFTEDATWDLMYYLITSEVIRYAEGIMANHRNRALIHSQKRKKSYMKILKSLNMMESELFLIRRILDESSEKVLRDEHRSLDEMFEFIGASKDFKFWGYTYDQIIKNKEILYKSYNSIYNLYQGFLEYKSKSITFILSILSIIIAIISLIVSTLL